MTISPLISVVLPAYNEAEAITKSLGKIEEYLNSQEYSWEIIIANDGSSDATASRVTEFIADKPAYQLLNLAHRGKSAAVCSGVAAASGEYILVTDVDLAVPISELKRFMHWAVEEKCDVISASREGKGATRVGEPYYRHFVGRIFNLLIQILILPGISDTQCGYKLFSKKAVAAIFPRLLVYGRDSPKVDKPFFGAFEVEVLFLARKLRLKVKELPVIWTFSPTRRFNFVGNSWRMFRDIVKIRILYLKRLYKI
ncbi:MAG: glycosyltransferase [candidate division WWE3 bacterium]|nr:glycosyltransferase [candidate division WWE3 bacterium]